MGLGPMAAPWLTMDDLDAQSDAWRTEIANPRVHATTGRVVDEHFAEERPALIAHPAIPYSAVLTVERRVSHEGMVSVGGNLYSVPDATRKRVVEVQSHPEEVRVFEDGRLVGSHLRRGRAQPAMRRPGPPPGSAALRLRAERSRRRASATGVSHDAVRRRLAAEGAAS